MALRVTTTNRLALFDSGTAHPDVPVNIGLKPTVLLVLLAAAGPHGVARRAVRDLLWEGTSDANASNSLRQSIFRLRRALGAEALEDLGGRLFLRRPISVDLFEAERLIAEGRLTEALDIVTAPVGALLDLAGPAMQGWVRDLRARFDRRLLDALTQGWTIACRGPAPEVFAPVLARAQQVLGNTPELLWLQLDAAATLADGAAFERTAARLAPAGSRGQGLAARDEVTNRIQGMRTRLQARIADGSGVTRALIHGEALRALEDGWQRARGGTRSVTCLAGETGTGRSWLLRQLAHRCLAEGGRTVQIVALGSAAGIPSACLRDLAIALQGYRGGAGVNPEYADTIARLLEGGLTPPGDAVLAVHDLLSAVAGEGPLLVTLDDAHHYDARMLLRLLRRLQEVPVAGLLVVPVVLPRMVDDLPQVTIGRTSPDGIRTLLGAMARLPRAEWVPPFVDAVHRVSDGRPGRAAQVVVRLHAAGHLAVVDDRWNLTTSLRETLSALTSTAA